MKVSDILTLVAVLAAGASAYFAYESWQDFHGKPFDDTVRGESGARKLRYTKNSPAPRAPLVATLLQRNNFLAERLGVLETKEGELAGLRKDVAGLEKENKQLAEEILKATSEKADLQENIRKKNNAIKTNEDTIKKYEEALSSAGNPEELKRQVSENIARLKQADLDLATEQANLEAALQRKDNLETSLAALRRKETMQQSGVMEADFSSTVREVFSRWGFVTINGGASRGVNAKTKLHVMRGGDKIADLQVTTVEPNVAVCAIVPGTLAADVAIAPGDRIVVAKVESTPTEVSEPAPAAAPAPEAAPFGEIPAAAPAEPAGF
jgi:predicted RNase H-like nuclease (RuvC/YqgF family)